MYMIMQEQQQHLSPDTKAKKEPLFHMFPDSIVFFIIIMLQNAIL